MGSIQILSREIVKLSSPTPPHNTRLKLSYLDQISPHMYLPLIFFYQSNDVQSLGLNSPTHSQISHHLKQSLSHTLTSFYPFAGAIDVRDPSLIDCTDDASGVEFIEARAQACLADVIHNKNIEDGLHQYIPIDPTCCKTSLLAVKITFFSCGGISIGFCFSHRLADTESFMAFVEAWAATSRGDPHFLQYSFDLANHFPNRHVPDHVKLSPAFDQNVQIKRFVFDEETVKALKREATSPLVANPTSVESVSAFIWEHLIEVAKSKPSEASTRTSIACHAVNLRKRTKQIPLHSLENVFGNCLMLSAARYNNTDSDTTNTTNSTLYQVLVSRMRNGITKINKDYIVNAENGDNWVNDLAGLLSMASKGEPAVEMYAFSSWCKSPMYGIDFGWGNPIWVCTTALPAMNGIVLMDTKYGNGIEAWINVAKHKLEMLDSKIKLIAKLV